MTRALKVLVELRAAFDGFSGIPQETRLLFRGLAGMDGVDVAGLLQSGNLVLESGLPVRDGEPVSGGIDGSRIDRLSKVVVSLQQGPMSHRLEHVRKVGLKLLGPASAALASIVGRTVPLTAFESTHFKDFIWRSLFAKSLPDDDFAVVTSRPYRVLRWPWDMLHVIGVVSGLFRMAIYARLDTASFDVMIVETPFPARVRRGTRLVVRYHDAIPLLMPHTIRNRSLHRAAHHNALLRNARDGAWFACVSEATRRDLLAVLPQLAERAVTIPNMVSHHYFIESTPAGRVPEVIWTRKNRRAPHSGGAEVMDEDMVDGALPFLLMVGTLEPRKNHLALLDAWARLRSDGHPHLNLVLVGSMGWEHDSLLQGLSPALQRGGLHLLEAVPSADLRLLYCHALVTVCPSFGEGFDFPGVEAMRCGGVVAASDIPVHRDVFGDACAYFRPYSAEDQAECLRSLIGPDATARRQSLIAEGSRVSAAYLPEAVLPQWNRFLQTIAGAD